MASSDPGWTFQQQWRGGVEQKRWSRLLPRVNTERVRAMGVFPRCVSAYDVSSFFSPAHRARSDGAAGGGFTRAGAGVRAGSGRGRGGLHAPLDGMNITNQ